MSALSRILRDQASDQIAFWCPGCDIAHAVVVKPPHGWKWNGDPTRPTFTPSVLVRGGHYASHYKPGDHCWCTYRQEHPEADPKYSCGICHSYVTDGQIQFLDDCTHALKGRTVPLPPWPGETEQTQDQENAHG